MPQEYTWLERLVSSVSIPCSFIRIQTTQLKKIISQFRKTFLFVFLFVFQGRVRKLTNKAFATCELGLGSAGYANGTAAGARSGLWMGLGVPVPISCFVPTLGDKTSWGMGVVSPLPYQRGRKHTLLHISSLCAKGQGRINIRTKTHYVMLLSKRFTFYCVQNLTIKYA